MINDVETIREVKELLYQNAPVAASYRSYSYSNIYDRGADTLKVLFYNNPANLDRNQIRGICSRFIGARGGMINSYDSNNDTNSQYIADFLSQNCSIPFYVNNMKVSDFYNERIELHSY